MTRFSLDGPYSPGETISAADDAAEIIRYLNYCTAGPDALEQPADIDRLLSALATMASRLPQLFMQLQNNLTRITAAPGLYDDRGHDPSVAVARAAMSLGGAHGAAHALWEALDAAHQASAHLGVSDEGSDGNG